MRTRDRKFRSYKQLLSELRALYERGDQQGVVDLAIEEIEMFPAYDAEQLYHMPAYKASRELIDDLTRRVRWMGGV